MILFLVFVCAAIMWAIISLAVSFAMVGDIVMWPTEYNDLDTQKLADQYMTDGVISLALMVFAFRFNAAAIKLTSMQTSFYSMDTTTSDDE